MPIPKTSTFFCCLVISLVGLILVIACLQLLPPAPIATHLRDYEGFWLAGLLASKGDLATLYDPTTLGEKMRLYFGTHGQSQGFPYPPSSLLFFLPLPLLEPATGLAVFSASVLLLLLAMAYKIARSAGVMLTLGFSGLHLAFDYGQLTPLITALLGLCLVQLERRPRYAGLLAGLAIIKPHLGPLLALGLLAGRSSKTILSACAVALFIIGTSLLLFPQGWAAFWGFATQVLHIPLAAPDLAARFISPYFWLQAMGVGKLVSGAIQMLVSVGCGIIIWRVFAARSLADPLAYRLIALGLLAPLAFPYAYAYDVCLNLLAILGAARLALVMRLDSRLTLPLLVLYFLPALSWLGYGGVVLTGVQMACSLGGAGRVLQVLQHDLLGKRVSPPT